MSTKKSSLKIKQKKNFTRLSTSKKKRSILISTKEITTMFQHTHINMSYYRVTLLLRTREREKSSVIIAWYRVVYIQPRKRDENRSPTLYIHYTAMSTRFMNEVMRCVYK